MTADFTPDRSVKEEPATRNTNSVELARLGIVGNG